MGEGRRKAVTNSFPQSLTMGMLGPAATLVCRNLELFARPFAELFLLSNRYAHHWQVPRQRSLLVRA